MADLDPLLKIFKTKVYDQCSFEINSLVIEKESKEYEACSFQLNNKKVHCRKSKITPKKIGQFVCFWKRSSEGPIAPFDFCDTFDFFVVNIEKDDRLGQFVFPKSELIKKALVSSSDKEGKRAFRVYPSWDEPTSMPALRTQNWQLKYFYEITTSLDIEKVNQLYK